jgi:flagellar motor switch protein FliM
MTMSDDWGEALANPAGGGTQVLDQAAIDNLLGVDATHDESHHGVLALVNSGLVSYERLPMLDIVFDRLVRMLSTSLRNLTSDNVDVTLDQIASVRFSDYMNSLPVPSMISVFKATEWDNYGLLTVDSALIYSTVDVLLGGRRGTAAMRIEGRPYTTIERNIIERMVHVVLGDLTAAFDPLSAVTFKFERLETNPRLAAISRPGNAAVLVKLRIDMEDRGGRIELLIPYATLEPVRELLLQMFMGEKFGRDSIWENHLSNELYHTNLELRAVLGETVGILGDVLEWKVGTRVMLDCTPESLIEMKCGDRPMYIGRMGKRGGRIAVKILSEAKREGEE